jgi:hypothetical protein
MKLNSKKYQDYINSFDWYLKRRKALERAGHKCERCHATEDVGLEVHHLTYERLGDENDEDLLVVCKPCHKIEDRKREQRSAERLYEARLDGWATKKYGEDWHIEYDADEIAEEFDEWLEER